MLGKVIFFILIIIFFCSLNSCFTFRKSDNSSIKKVNKSGLELTAKYFPHKGKTYRYLHFKNPNSALPLLVLIHGAPGSSSNFLDFLKYSLITDHYSVIIVDRFGYGYSNYGHYSSIIEQTDVIIYLIKSCVNVNQDVFIAGHSYGGTIAAALASQQPKFLTAAALMAPALDPENEKYFWIGHLGKWKATRWMVSGALKVATDEKYNHAEELRYWRSAWKNIKTPLLHIHGNKDKLVPFINLTFALNSIPNQYLEVYEWDKMNHFFPFSETEKTIELLHGFFSQHKTSFY